MRYTKTLLTAVTLAVVIALAWTVWPTPYRYIGTWPRLVRVNRVTGTPQLLTEVGWRPMAPNPFVDLAREEQRLRDSAAAVNPFFPDTAITTSPPAGGAAPR